MPLVAPTVWTGRRKWLGNLIPALFWLPPVAFGFYTMVRTGQVVGPGLWWMMLGTVLGWLAVNFFGFIENGRMKRQLQLILESKKEPLKDAVFVGIATPKFSSAVDPHEDVGYLRFLPDRLSFASETRTIDLFREQVTKVRFRANVHTVLGLGRWVSIEGESEGKPIRLMVEPREKATLMGNLLYSKKLAQRIRRWIATT
jgi:hypothetical protein